MLKSLTIAVFSLAALCYSAAANPKMILIGDSTVQNGTKGQKGWGSELQAFFDESKATIVNKARGGRSSRTFYKEGLWTSAVEQIQPGDVVLMQFGHNDNGKVFGDKARASLKGTGEETEEGDNPDGTHEVVHTYGWYLRQYIRDTKAKGGLPIVVSPIPRNRWDEKTGKVHRESGYFGKWCKEVAEAEGVPYLDLNERIADKYDALGPDKVKGFFEGDWTHTNPAGAEFNAECVVEGLSAIKEADFASFLSAKGKEAAKSDQK